MRRFVFLVLVAATGLSFAKLPASSPAEKELTLQNAARQIWSNKQDAFASCKAQDRVVKNYQEGLRTQGKPVPPVLDTGPCTDPGPYAADAGTPIANRPTEASGAHSPPATAVNPPSTTIPQSELQRKK